MYGNNLKGDLTKVKLLDKFLKILNVNRNTFFTYILTLVTVYLAVDRIVEMLIMILSGVACNYWNPIQYTLALACPVFAFAFSPSSSFSDTRASKITLFYTFLIGFYIIALSMFTQYLNAVLWLAFISSPSYVNIITNFSELVKPAFCAISLYLPLTTVYPFVKFILLKVDDSMNMIKSIWDFRGINLSDSKAKHGPYACDLAMFKDFDSAQKISLPENSRFSSLFVCGGSGTGKTAMIFEPIIAQDIEKKYFFTEASKELGFTALKTGIANLTKPYSNDYLNKNFNLNMLAPSFGKDTLFNTFVQKMAISTSPYIYKNVGITYMSPDYETLDKMMKVCKNYNVDYNLIDPSQPESSIGLNPFIYDDPTKTAIIISSTLKGITDDEADEMKDLYIEEASLQILENLAILLKLVYPKMHDGALPNMEDLLSLLSNFELVEKMCKILEADEDLARDHKIELSYFKRAFFANGKSRSETEKNTFIIASRLENLLRAPKIRYILCNRHTNINFDDALANGEVTFLCTRRGESGKVAHKAFGLFFLLSMQNSILSRPGNEKTRIPHFLYIDEFPDFLNRDTETIFTMYRKYKVATTISAQSYTQLSNRFDKGNKNSTVLSNCANKIYTGGSTPYEELQWWEHEIGEWTQWKFSQNYNGKTGVMDSNLGNPELKYVIKISANRMANFGLNSCAYKFMQDGGKFVRGQGILKFLDSKYLNPHKGKTYNFGNYSTGGNVDSENSTRKHNYRKLTTKNGKNINFIDERNGEINPVQNIETKYSFEKEEGSIVIDLKHNDKK